MPPAFMWIMEDSDDVVFTILHHRVVVEVHARADTRKVTVTTHGAASEARHDAVNITSIWERLGLQLGSVYLHRNPLSSGIASGMLQILARYNEGKREELTGEFRELSDIFFREGLMIHG